MLDSTPPVAEATPSPTHICALCLSGDATSVVPRGAGRAAGKPCCERCLDALSEADQRPPPATTVHLRLVRNDDGSQLELSGRRSLLNEVIEAVDLRVTDHGRIVGGTGSALVRLWHPSAKGEIDEVVGEVMRAIERSGLDAVLAPEVVALERAS